MHLLMEQTVNYRTKECYTLVSEIAGIDIRNESEFMACFVIDAGIRNKLESIINRNNDFSINRILYRCLIHHSLHLSAADSKY